MPAKRHPRISWEHTKVLEQKELGSLKVVNKLRPSGLFKIIEALEKAWRRLRTKGSSEAEVCFKDEPVQPAQQINPNTDWGIKLGQSERSALQHLTTPLSQATNNRI
ncbi:hypothetical protein HPP92_028646, partial [Vanilla planifolia]